MGSLLSVENLSVQYPGVDADHPVRAVDGLTFSLRKAETYALVGESGCGKSATALALLRLVEPGTITAGRIVFEGRDLIGLPEREMRKVRGGRIGIVFQEASAALNPVMRIGSQIAEALRIHKKMNRRQAADEAVRLLRRVALSDPERQARAYPHELSGGMKQRVMLAIALSCSPSLLIADEPTTALDVTIQAQILALLRRLREELELTILLITHDLGVVAENADRVGVMYAGRLVEEAPVRDLFENPLHPYTRGLLRAMPARSDRALGRRLETLPGSVPDPAALPPGCRFHPRCPEAFAPCSSRLPADTAVAADRGVACFLYEPGAASTVDARSGSAPRTEEKR